MPATVTNIEYTASLPPSADFVRLFRSTGWETDLTDAALGAALTASWYCVDAYDGERLVGVGRVVSDGAIHALIADVIVEPGWQGHGIGSEIVRRLVARCREAGIDQVQLFCAKGKRPFYERLGFVARADDAPGMELV